MLRFSFSKSLLLVLVLLLTACGGGGGNNGGGGGGGGTAPSTPTGLTATAGDAQVSLTWTASSGATTYNVKRGTATGGPYTTVSSPAVTNFTDTGRTNGTTYYYVVSAVNANGESANSAEKSATPALPIPAAPTGVTATPGDTQVSLSWTASANATGYHVKRSTTSGSGYTQVGAPSGTSFNDTGLTNSTTYYYVVTAVNASGESSNSSQVSAVPASAPASVHVTVDTLSNRHAISSYIYGGAYPKNASAITDSGLSVVRWGGNATSTYNWQLHTYNADNDYYFEDFNSGGFGDGSDGDSVQWLTDVKAAGGSPLMTMAMLPWVAKSAENGSNGHWSFSVAKYGAQCGVDQYNTDAGNGIVAGTCSSSSPTYLTADPNDAYFPLLDDHNATCPGGTTCYYRNDWTAALATAFGSAPHFYDMDNETDIWGGTHRDIHSSPAAYEELRDVYLTEARNLKTWDPLAIRLGPVSCCWWFYWNGADSNDKGAHGGVDFLPWWLNEVYWQDQIAGTRSLDIFDIHAYPDGPDTSSWTQAQKRALAARIYRDYWDPTYTSESGTINQIYTTQIQPNHAIPFRIPRMRAIANTIYPGTPLALTEWSAAFAGESDFSTALGDADAFGIMGRERVYLASRWVAPDPANPNYQALKLLTNYDGAHHGFGTISVAATHDASANLFSSFAALNTNGTQLTVLLINKDPSATQTAQVVTNGFTPNQVTIYKLTSSSPTTIVASGPSAWPSTFSLAPYSITLLVASGTMAQTPAAEWDLNPDVITVPANGTVALSPKIVSGSGTVALTSPQSDTGVTLSVAQGNLTTSTNGAINVTAGGNPGFYHFTLTGVDGSGVSQTQGGWILVGNPPATLSKSLDPGSGTHGTAITLQATINAGSSGGSNSGASVFFTTDAGTLSSRVVKTNGSGQASVQLTLPSSTGTVHVTAEGPFELGHPAVTFTETSQ